MPRIKYITAAKEPPIDWLKALILERIDAKDMNLKVLAGDCGICYETLRRLMTKSPWDWKREQRKAVCKALKIDEEIFRKTATF